MPESRSSNPAARTGWPLVALVVIAAASSTIAVNAVVFRPPVLNQLQALRAATGGLVSPTLIGSAIPLVSVVGICIFLIGRVPPREIGWVRSGILPACLVTFGIWVSVQAAFAAIQLAGGNQPQLHPVWERRGVLFVLGELGGQIFGNALLEETVFRGFLFTQLLILFQEFAPRRSAFLLAAILSQAFFAVTHIPNRLLVDPAATGLVLDQVLLLVSGLLFLAVYLITANLWIAVGLHALVNTPTPLVQAGEDLLNPAIVGATLFLLLVWRPLANRVRARRCKTAELPERV
ncbi:MAG: hypothetical protein KatS3mg081_0740 [Gemmatimonadales bacterium]|nr:MAG: hypothetical protein KatS3mg081_0740 [Gemmatimonadales bacterium]